MTILDGGNVGIGTTAPTYKLGLHDGTIGTSFTNGQTSNTVGAAYLSYSYGTNNAANLDILTLDRSSATGLWAGGGGRLLFKNRQYGGAASLASAGISAINTVTVTNAAKPALIFETGDAGTITEKMRITYDGNVGIGTTSPIGVLQIVKNPSSREVVLGDGNYLRLRFNGDNSTAGIINRSSSGTAGALYFGETADTGNYIFRGSGYLTTEGAVGIGTTNPSQKLEVSGGMLNIINSGAVPGTGPEFALGSIADGYKWIQSYHSRALVLNPIGNYVGIGTTAPGYALQVGNAGDGSEARANAWNALSDSTFKTNITPLTNSLAKIMQLEGVSFAWKSNGKENLGLIAQNVQGVFPELIATDSDGILSLNYDGLSAPIIQAIKEQQTQIDDLRGSSLKVEVDGLSSIVAALQDMIKEIGDKVTAMTVKFSTKESHQEKLCVGTESDEICLSKEQIKAVIDNLPSPTATASAIPTTTPQPSPSPSFDSSPSASSSATPTPSSTP
jgi:hypothetical protein